MKEVKITDLIRYVIDTRRYGHTYVHSNVREQVTSYIGIEGLVNGERVILTYCGWGRSLQTKNGHKYKAHLRYVDSRKPVPSKLLKQVL